MTFAVLVAQLLGQGISIRDRLALQDALHHSPSRQLRRLVVHVMGYTLAVEAAGALLLFLRWRGQHPDGQALYLAAFHSVSAFCNAGFSLYPDNLVRWRGDAWTNVVVAGLIVLGGLGFLVSLELREHLASRLHRKRPPPTSLQARLVLRATAALLLLGMLAVLALEWDNLLRGLPLDEKLLAAFFQSVTPRTAGFNTLDYGAARSATLLVTGLLMFVGASPGSTGGGIKTTTLALLVAYFGARWRGQGRVSLLRRTVPQPVLDRALSLTVLSGFLVLLLVLLLCVTEQGPVGHAGVSPSFLELLFETVSAFGTVGLSTGITPRLTGPGQLLLVLTMFVGRLGPITVSLAAGPQRPGPSLRWAEENVMVG
jgi:trk system potassium uptake protein TrkH